MADKIYQTRSNKLFCSERGMEVFGVAQPQCFTNPRTPRGDELVMEAHKAARAVIREVCPHVKVGLTLSLHDIQVRPDGEDPAQKDWDDEFTHYLSAIADDDFLGVQNYARSRYDANGSMPAPEGAELTPHILHEFVEKIVIHAATDPHSKVNRRQEVDILLQGYRYPGNVESLWRKAEMKETA